jgi:hypothetical protein
LLRTTFAKVPPLRRYHHSLVAPGGATYVSALQFKDTIMLTPIFALLLPKLASSPLVLVSLASIALYASGRFMFRRDEAVEDRRRKAIKLAGDCQKCGLDFLAPVLEDYSVGDYSAMLHRLRAIADDIRDDATRRQILDHFFSTQLAARLKDAAQRQKIVEAVETTPTPPAS